jgi:hypothetical protein
MMIISCDRRQSPPHTRPPTWRGVARRHRRAPYLITFNIIIYKLLWSFGLVGVGAARCAPTPNLPAKPPESWLPLL